MTTTLSETRRDQAPVELSEEDESDSPRTYYAEIMLMCLASLLLEIAYTRIISFKLFYYYTFMVIGLALLGIGCGGVLVAVSKRLRRASTDAVILWGLLVAAFSVLLGYVLVARIPIDSLAIWDYGSRASVINLAALVAICVALFASFVAVGVMIATLFGRRTRSVGRLYFWDLLGAGTACAIAIFLLLWIGPPATIFLAGFILAATGTRVAIITQGLAFRRTAIVVGLALSAVLGVGTVAPSTLPQVIPDSSKTWEYPSEVFSRWGAIFRVDAYDVVTPTGDEARLLLHDGMLGSAVYRYDGNPASLERFNNDPRLLPFAFEDAPRDRVMVIGAAGGNEILAAMHFDATSIDAIELNPVTYDLVTDYFADYSGRLHEDPRVNYVRGDGRTFLARSEGLYDLIWYPAPDSYSATNVASSGAFVLSESYLYTIEVIEESLRTLTDGGIIAAQFGEIDYETKPNRTARYVSTARRALENYGVEDPSRHIIVVTSPTEGPSVLSSIMVKRTPFTPEEVDQLIAGTASVPGAQVRYAPGHPREGDPTSLIATADAAELEAFYAGNTFDVTPVVDDQPFFWHFSKFPTVIQNYLEPINRFDTEDSVGERVLLLLLGIAVLLGTVFLLLPFFAVRKIWSTLPRKGVSAIYFSCLGFGFMFFQISLIQRLVLFLGYPTYSLTVTLASILIFTGAGALLSGRVAHRAGRLILPLGAAVATLTVFYFFALPVISDVGLSWPFPIRVAVALAILAPLGLTLGMFMPLGLAAVGAMTNYPREYVAWGWAVNGFTSVTGAVLTTILGMTLGFNLVLVLAFFVYCAALASLRILLAGRVGVSAA